MIDYTCWGIRELIEELEKRDAEKAAKEKGNEIHLVWSIEDVRQQLEDRGEGESMSDEECRKVLHEVERCHDATIGVTYDTLDYWISEVISERIK